MCEQKPGNKWEVSHGWRDLLESEVSGVERLAFSCSVMLLSPFVSVKIVLVRSTIRSVTG